MKEYKYEIKNEKFLEEFQKKLDLFESETIKDTKLEEGKSLQIAGATIRLNGNEITVIINEEVYNSEVKSIMKRLVESEDEAFDNYLREDYVKKECGISSRKDETIKNIFKSLKEEIIDSEYYEQYIAIKGLLKSGCIEKIEEYLNIPSEISTKVNKLYEEAKKVLLEDVNYQSVIDYEIRVKCEEIEDIIMDDYYDGYYEDSYVDWYYHYEIDKLPEKTLALIDTICDFSGYFKGYIKPVNEELDNLDDINVFDNTVDKKYEVIDKNPEISSKEKSYDYINADWTKEVRDYMYEAPTTEELIEEVEKDDDEDRKMTPENIVNLIPAEAMLKAAKEDINFTVSLGKEKLHEYEILGDRLANIITGSYYETDDDDETWYIHGIIKKTLEEKYPEEMEKIIETAKEEEEKENKDLIRYMKEQYLLSQMGVTDGPSKYTLKRRDKKIIYGPDDEYGYDQYNGYKRY